MTTPPRWRPLPAAVGLDPRVRYVSPAACRAWLLLVCASDAGGVVRGAAGMEAAAIVAAVVGCPEIEGAGLLGELEDAELLTAHPTHLRLPDVAAWTAECTPSARASTVAPPASAPDARPAREIALARLRSSFSKRSLATVETRRAWLATDEGRERLAELGLAAEDGEALAATAGRRGGRFGIERPAVVAPPAVADAAVASVVANGCSATTGTAVATAVASVSPTPPSETEKSRGEGVSGARHPVVADGCSATTETAVATVVASPAVAPAKAPASTLTTPWSVLVESAGGAVEGLTADPATAAAINATLREKLDADPPTLTLADVRSFGEVLKRDGAKAHFTWIKRRYATARDLYGYHRNCSPLLEALADWKRAQSEAPSAPTAPAAPARPKRAPRKPITPELRARLNTKETPS